MNRRMSLLTALLAAAELAVRPADLHSFNCPHLIARNADERPVPVVDTPATNVRRPI